MVEGTPASAMAASAQITTTDEEDVVLCRGDGNEAVKAEAEPKAATARRSRSGDLHGVFEGSGSCGWMGCNTQSTWFHSAQLFLGTLMVDASRWRCEASPRF